MYYILTFIAFIVIFYFTMLLIGARLVVRELQEENEILKNKILNIEARKRNQQKNNFN